MGSITLNTRAERRKLLNKNTRTRVDTQMIGTKKNTFQLELKNRFTALEEHDDMDSLNKNMTEIIQQSAMSIAKQTKRQKKPKISSPTKALMKKRREMIENNTPRDHIEYVEICKTIKKKAREDIRKHNLDEIRETIEASKSLKKVRRTQNLGKNRMITLLDKHGKEIQEQDKIMERIEEFYSELYDSDQAVTIQTVPKEVPPIMAWEVEAARGGLRPYILPGIPPRKRSRTVPTTLSGVLVAATPSFKSPTDHLAISRMAALSLLRPKVHETGRRPPEAATKSIGPPWGDH